MNLNNIRAILVQELSDWVEAMPEPDKPMVGLAGPNQVLSARDLLREVERETPLGEAMLEHWAALSFADKAKASFAE
jgi:hypothetical protein